LEIAQGFGTRGTVKAAEFLTMDAKIKGMEISITLKANTKRI
jgi:hypothetical protein